MNDEYDLKKYPRTGTQIGDALDRVMQDGRRAFHDEKFRSPYGVPTHPFYAVYIHAWVAEDLRQALIKASPSYAKSQEAFTVKILDKDNNMLERKFGFERRDF